MCKSTITHAFDSTNTRSMHRSAANMRSSLVSRAGRRTISRQPALQIARIRRYALEKLMKPSACKKKFEPCTGNIGSRPNSRTASRCMKTSPTPGTDKEQDASQRYVLLFVYAVIF